MVIADTIYLPEEKGYHACVWRLNTSKERSILSSQSHVYDSNIVDSDHVHTIVLNNTFLVVAQWNREMVIYRTSDLHVVWRHAAHLGVIHKMYLLKNDQSENCGSLLTIAGGFNSRDRSLRLWDVRMKKMVTELTPDVKISNIVVTEDFRYFVLDIQGNLAKFLLHSKSESNFQ